MSFSEEFNLVKKSTFRGQEREPRPQIVENESSVSIFSFKNQVFIFTNVYTVSTKTIFKVVIYRKNDIFSSSCEILVQRKVYEEQRNHPCLSRV